MENDEFGCDPAVRSMRHIFSRMEAIQKNMLEAVALPPLDRRLRVWREHALQLFEQAWGRAGRRGLTRSEEDAALLYAHCLARILERGRIPIPPEALTRNEVFEQIIQEILK
jgi:hypothetical protein